MHYSSGLRHWGFQLLGFYCKCFESRLSGRGSEGSGDGGGRLTGTAGGP